MNQNWDAGGDASAALLHVVEGFGPPVLGRPDMLEGLLADDVPQLTREIAMLTAAARYGVADQISDRVRQGMAPPAAVATVASDMSARTAVDSAGALWAASVFARAVGLPVGGPQVAGGAGDTGITIPPPGAGPPPAVPTRIIGGEAAPGLVGFPPAPTAPVFTPPGQTVADGAPPAGGFEGEIYEPPAAAADQQTILPGAPGFPGYPGQPAPGYPAPGYPTADYPAPGYPGQPTVAYPSSPGYPSTSLWPGQAATTATAVAGNSQGLAVAAAVCFAIAAAMQPFVGLGTQVDRAFHLLFWTTAIAQLLVFAAAAIWVSRSKGSAAGFAVTVGIAVPSVPFGIYTALLLPNAGTPGLKHSLLVLTTIVWLLASVVASFVGLAGLSGQRQLVRARSIGPGPLAAVFGILFALANIGAQETVPGPLFDNPGYRLGIFGTGTTGIRIFWALILILLFAVPPLLAGFAIPDRTARIGLLAGWLLLTFAWQVSDTPIAGYVAAPGLYLTWAAWIATLLATVALVTQPPPEAVDLRR